MAARLAAGDSHRSKIVRGGFENEIDRHIDSIFRASTA
jgi:hypothetical protein